MVKMGVENKIGLHFEQNEHLLADTGLELFSSAEVNRNLDVQIPHIAGGVIIGNLKSVADTTPISLRSVYVPKERIPLRQLSYIIETLEVANALIKQGLSLSEIVIVCPCHLSDFVNGTKSNNQIERAQLAMTLFSQIQSRYPKLSGVSINYDFGLPITNSQEELTELGYLVQENISPPIESRLQTMAGNHIESHEKNLHEVAPYLYLFDHGPAWSLTASGGISYPKPSNKTLTIAYAPQSEAIFLAGVSELVDATIGHYWQPAAVMLFSGRQVYPPYYLQRQELSCTQPELLSLNLQTDTPQLPQRHIVAQAAQALRGPSNSWKGDQNLTPLIDSLNLLQARL